jgi:nucleoside-diphosphate-sugar epimerase
MNVLVVGGAGYVGGAVVDKLLETTYNVRVYDALLYEESYRKDVDFVYGDIRDKEKLLPHLKWADTVVWLAALVGDGACALNPEVTVQINQEPVKWLGEQFTGRIIFTSTCSVYGAQDGILDESSSINPLSVYAATKLEAEKYLMRAGIYHGSTIIFRLGTLFGVGDSYSRIRLDLVVNTMTARAAKQGYLNVYGGEQFRPLLHVKDVAETIKNHVGSTFTGIYNLNKQNVRILDLACQVRNHFPDLEIITKDIPMQDARSYRVKKTKLVGFNPIYSIDQGIEEVKELIENNRIKDLASPRYTNHAYLSMFNTHMEVVGA